MRLTCTATDILVAFGTYLAQSPAHASAWTQDRGFAREVLSVTVDHLGCRR